MLPVYNIMQAQASIKKISFLQKVTFICSLLFIISIAIRYTHIDDYLPQPLIELAALLGWFVSPFLSLITCIIIIIYIIKYKSIIQPKWLTITNILLFISQIILYTQL